jgi:dTDP-4-dehydrorhamnose 3,5-epimerase
VIFAETPISGAYLVDIERVEDERGFFARTWCQREFESHVRNARLVQCNISFNRKKGTLRGMHYQVEPHAEAKLVRCSAGAIYDVIIDLRAESNSYRRWFGVELTGENRRALFIPEGLAHGFLTLRDDSEVFYQMSEFYDPACVRGVRWDDPAFGVQWPAAVTVISARDASYPDFSS